MKTAPSHDRKSSLDGFHLGYYLTAHGTSALVVGGLALLIDTVLISQGVRIAFATEAAISGLSAFLTLIPALFLMWHLGIVRLSHYLLAALVLFAPLTLLLAMIYPHFGLMILPPETYPWVEADRLRSFELSVRLVRSGLLAPIYMYVFWLIYQQWLSKGPG